MIFISFSKHPSAHGLCKEGCHMMHLLVLLPGSMPFSRYSY
jgi:hypothetical protein